MIIGYDSDTTDDETILGFMNYLTPATRLMPLKFGLCNYLAQEIHSQLE